MSYGSVLAGPGSVLRWWIGVIVGERYHGEFPLGTFLINVSDSFVIGYLSVLFGVDWRDRYGAALNALVLTGVLGGYTTFSSMQLDAAKLAGKARQGRLPRMAPSRSWTLARIGNGVKQQA